MKQMQTEIQTPVWVQLTSSFGYLTVYLLFCQNQQNSKLGARAGIELAPCWWKWGNKGPVTGC